MKSFLHFITETATQQATRLGLEGDGHGGWYKDCLLYTSPSPRDISGSRMPSSA